jgi:hypothetical protein
MTADMISEPTCVEHSILRSCNRNCYAKKLSVATGICYGMGTVLEEQGSSVL